MSYMVMTQHDLGSDGYLSDVISHHSNTASEISQDLILSTKTLEKHFKDKYQTLRHAYEQRVKSLSDVVHSLYRELCADELIAEMRADKASAPFIPAHLSEVIERHLEQERERFLHECVQKIGTLETELLHAKKSNGKLKEDYEARGSQLSAAEKTYKQQLTALKQSLQHKSEECEKLKKLSDQKMYEVNILEQSFEQSARELAIIEGIDKQGQHYQREMKEQLVVVTNQRNDLNEEVIELRNRCKLLTEEFDRHQVIQRQKQEEEEVNRKRISAMMQQVEEILEQETNDSNMAISTVHEKMKTFRNRMIAELQREKRLAAALQEELQSSKAIRDDINRENRRLIEEESSLREKLANEQMRIANMERELKALEYDVAEKKVLLHDQETRFKYLEEKHLNQQSVYEQEAKLHEEKIRLEVKQQFEDEQRHIEQRTMTYKLHYDNEVQKLNQQMRQSYIFPQHMKTASEAFAALGSHADPLQNELSYRKLIDQVFHEKEELEQQHLLDVENLRAELEHNYQVEMQEREEDLMQRQEQVVQGMKDMLSEASKNIEKLKTMVKEGRTVIDLQNQRIEQLKKDNTQLSNNRVVVNTSPANIYPPMNNMNISNMQTPKQVYQADMRTPLQGYHTPAMPQSVLESSSNVSKVFPPAEPQPYHQESQQYPMQAYQNQNFPPNIQPSVTSARSNLGQGQDAVMQDVSLVVDNNSFFTTENPHPTGRDIPVRRNSFGSNMSQTSKAQLLQTQSSNASQASNAGSHVSFKQTMGNASQASQVSARSATNSQKSNGLKTTSNASATSQRMGLPSNNSSYASGVEDGNSNVSYMTTHVQVYPETPSILPTNSQYGSSNASVVSHASVASISNQTNYNAALEETRIVKLRNSELEQEILSLKSHLEQFERELNESKKINDGLVAAASVAAAVVTNAKQTSAKRSSASSAISAKSLNDNSTIATPDQHRFFFNSTTNTQPSTLRRTSFASSPNDSEIMSEDDEDSVLEMVDIGVNTMENTRVNDLLERLDHLEIDYKQLQDKYQHQEALFANHKVDLERERERVLEYKKRESKLYQLLITVDKTYREQLYKLKSDMQHVRNMTSNFAATSSSEVLTTINNYKLQFQVIFKHYHEKQERKLKELRISLTNSHQKEMNVLESRFIEQINILNKKQTKELDKLHEELLARTEHALNVSMTHELENEMSLNQSGNGLPSNAAPMNTTTLVSQSLELLSQSALHLNTSKSLDLSSVAAPMKHHDNHPSNVSVSASFLESRAAYESVLSGVLQALVDQEAIVSDTSNKVLSLAKAHFEPSFAATAAARALIGEEIDMFALRIVQQKFQLSPSGVPVMKL